MRARIATVQLIHLADKAARLTIESKRITRHIDFDSLVSLSAKAERLFMNDIIHVTLSKSELDLLTDYI